MNENHIPTEEELDALVQTPPAFDLDAVKRRTMEHIAPARKHRFPLRGLCIAAVICALSVTAMAAADYASSGPISRALGLVPAPAAEEAPAPAVEEQAPTPAAPLPVPQASPPAQTEEETPELDEALSRALSVPPELSKSLRPAVQKVEKTVEQQGVGMTVLQTLGDANRLYLKVRFDFPEGAPHGGYLRFSSLRVTLSDSREISWNANILDQDDRSVTYLLNLHLNGQENLTGQTITLTAQDYGHPHAYTPEEMVEVQGPAGKSTAVLVRPDGTVRTDLSEAEIAALTSASGETVYYSGGFVVHKLSDGSHLAVYDGLQGDQTVTVYLAPEFDVVVPGTWEHTWTLEYEDLARKWEGSQTVLDPHLFLTFFRISPLSWQASLTARELIGEELGAGLIYHRDWNAQLLHSDGTLTPVTLTASSFSGSDRVEGDTYISEFSTGNDFPSPIDMENVTAIVIDGVEIPLQ